MSGIRSLIRTKILLVLMSFQLQAQQFLVSPTAESYIKKSHDIGRKLERAFYLRAGALAASGVITVYLAWKILTSSEVASELAQKAAEETKKNRTWSQWVTKAAESFVNLQWVGKAVGSLTKLCAQTICLQWISSQVVVNGAAPKVYLARNFPHKLHSSEIDRLLQTRTAEGYLGNDFGHIDAALRGHLQGLVDKIEHLMAYMVCYGARHTLTHTYATIEQYAAETIKKVGILVEQFNNTQEENFIDAVQVCKIACSEIMIASIRYAVAVLPYGE